MLDESSRLYLLEMIRSDDVVVRTESLVCECYNNNMVRYMSDWERELICHVVNKLENIKYLSLQAVANNDLGEIILDYTPRMKNCNI